MLRLLVIFLFAISFMSCEQEPLTEVQDPNEVIIVAYDYENYNTSNEHVWRYIGYFVEDSDGITAEEKILEASINYTDINDCEIFEAWLTLGSGNTHNGNPDFYITTTQDYIPDTFCENISGVETMWISHNLDISSTNGDFVFIY